MREHDIKQFLKLCGAESSDFIVARGYVNVVCPLAPWTHQSGKDSKPSFGISINDEGESIYVCFGCSPEAKKLSDIIHSFWVYTKEYPITLAQFYLTHEIWDETKKENEHVFTLDVWEESENPFKELKPIPDYILAKFPEIGKASDSASSAVMAYLTYERKIDKATAEQSGIRYNPKDRSVIFPMTDRVGNIYTMRAKSIFTKDSWTMNENKCGYPELKETQPFESLRDSGALFGLNQVNWSKPLMLVEGGEDRLRLITLGYTNVVASLTTNFTQAQLENLKTAPVLIIGYDEDKAGSKSFAKILFQLRGKVPIFRVYWSQAGMSEKGSLCKDGGDLVDREQLLKVLTGMEEFV